MAANLFHEDYYSFFFCSDISLQLCVLCLQVAHQLTMKYGKEYADMCRRNGFETVNEKVNAVINDYWTAVVFELFFLRCSTLCFLI